MRRKHRTFRIIFITACIFSVALAACWMGQAIGIVPPFGIGWGDGNAPGGRGYALGIDRGIFFETLADVKRMPGGVVIGAEVKRRSFLGIGYQRTDVVAWKEREKRVPGTGTYGTQVRVTVTLFWPILISLAIAARYGVLMARARRRERTEKMLCPNCGYDLRATPERCPECGHSTASVNNQ
jgi:hypothetical protein